jgi:predicted nucleic acid-binding Zn ribbon protein
VSADGTLWVQVTTNAWMNELSLMKPQLLKALNARPGGAKIRDIRWQLLRT